jgi:chloramphenicol 3-O phosphotransferase
MVVPQFVILNGGSSAGKSTIARCLQEKLSTPWLVFGVDDLVEAIPQDGIEDGSLLRFGASGQVEVGPGWRDLERSWLVGLGAIGASGTGVIFDDVFLDGARQQERLRVALGGLEVFWVGVLCDAKVAAAREALRPGRVPGMAESQAQVVHDGVEYDMVVDTADTSPEECAAMIVSAMSSQA